MKFVVWILALLLLLCACGIKEADVTPSTIDTAVASPSLTISGTPAPTTQPDVEESPLPEPAPSEQASATPSAALQPNRLTDTPLSGITIGIDPGHQARSNKDPEPVSPGSSETKKKVSSGTQGRFTNVPEYKVNLNVGLKLKQLLLDLGANVVMTRETHDVNISNSERAIMMNEARADLVVRLHCNGSDDADKQGAFILIPSNECTAAINGASKDAARCILKAFIAATGAKDLGLQSRSDQTGFNWSTVPVVNVEMGHMTNETEDKLLATDDYQTLCAQGIASGIVDYFSK